MEDGDSGDSCNSNGVNNTVEDSSEGSTLKPPSQADLSTSLLCVDIQRCVKRDETAESILSHMTTHDFQCLPTEPVHNKVSSEENYSSLVEPARRMTVIGKEEKSGIGVDTKGVKQNEIEKRGAINLSVAFAIAVKHFLREERTHKFTDIAHLLIHVPRYHPDLDYACKNLPIDITLLLTDYCRRVRSLDLIDVQTQNAMNTALLGMLECLTSFETIRNTPIPLAYSIHLKHILIIFLLSLPFQIINVLYWITIPFMIIASFTLFGIESIAAEIENPFGLFCDNLRQEICSLINAGDKRDVSLWKSCILDTDTSAIDLMSPKSPVGVRFH
ncbi:hypothetical protein HDU76_003100 [Blyttiomyces sp. JEL0837]|nr:hypothetical protein HDU76_003100 [Blyttiomyces sp. JEL0837]